MSCFAIARLNARIDADTFDAISADAQGFEALRRWLEAQTGVTIRHTVGQTPAGEAHYFASASATVTIRRDGSSIIGTLPQVGVAQLEQFVARLGKRLVREKLEAAIRQLAFVESADTVKGTRVLTITT